MDRIFDMSQQPPYVEVYSHAPLMCASLVNTRQAMAASSPTDHVHWCHGVQCTMDDIASSLGLYKIKVFSNEGYSCLFAISPDMPPRQQADVMLHAAQQLLAALSKVCLPSGDRLAAQVTIHAGKYAGAVVGRSAFTYDLFGEDVQLLLDMERCNSPNCIQVSDPALALIDAAAGDFSPVCKISHSTRSIGLHRWNAEASGAQEPGVQQLPGITTASKQPPGWQQHKMPTTPQKQQHKGLEAAIAAAQQATQSTHWQGQEFSMRASSAVCPLQPDLRFPQPALEAAYHEAQSPSLARLDRLFSVLNLVATACCVWSPSSSMQHNTQQLLSCWPQWLVPVLASVWLLTAPRTYSRWRELVWVSHRLLAALHVAGGLLLSTLQHRHLMAAAAAAAAAGSGAVPAAAAAATRLSHRGKVLTLLADSLGFKVRFRVHVFVSTFTFGLVAVSTLWHWRNVGSAAGLQPLLWDLLQRCLLGWAAPMVLIYLWESEDRAWFLESLRRQQQGISSSRAGKAKVV